MVKHYETFGLKNGTFFSQWWAVAVTGYDDWKMAGNGG